MGEAALREGAPGGVAAFADTIGELAEANEAATAERDQRAATAAAAEAASSELDAEYARRLEGSRETIASIRAELEDLKARDAATVTAEGRLDAAEAELIELEEDHARAVGRSESERLALAEALATATKKVARIEGRKRATLVDLGREVVRTDPDADEARVQARASLARIEALRARRADIIAGRDAIDTAPITRTLAAVGALIALALAIAAVV